MKYLIYASLFISFNALADFGEIDLLVRESVGYYFSDAGREVDLSTLRYEQEPTSQDGIMTVYTSVRAVQGLTYAWDFHDCVTQIDIRSSYKDLGSECSFYPDH